MCFQYSFITHKILLLLLRAGSVLSSLAQLNFFWGTFTEGKQATQSIRGAGRTDLLFLMSVVKVYDILYFTIADLYV